MPLHDWKCLDGHAFERFIERDALDAPQHCDCGSLAERVFLKFPMSWVSPDICYDSPIDGRAITSMAQRRDDLARSDCVPYDPEMKKDHLRKLKEQDEALERSVDRTVDEEIAKMPIRKKDKLAAEMEAGLTAELVRQTVSA